MFCGWRRTVAAITDSGLVPVAGQWEMVAGPLDFSEMLDALDVLRESSDSGDEFCVVAAGVVPA